MCCNGCFFDYLSNLERTTTQTCYVVVLVYFATAESRGRYKRVYDNWPDASAHLNGLRRRAGIGDCEVWAHAEGGGLAQAFRTF